MQSRKPSAPAVGALYADRDARRDGRQVRVQRIIRRDRVAVCEPVDGGRQTRISYAVLAQRFERVSP